MPSTTLFAQVLPGVLLSMLLAQSPPQVTAPVSEITRVYLKENAVNCFIIHSVQPIYPREARLAHTEGVIKLALLIAEDNSIADLQVISGDPLLADSTIKAVRQWRVFMSYVNGHTVESEIPLSFTFSIEDPPRPAYLHLANGRVVRADEVREFTHRIEYVAGRRTHRISANSVADINACARFAIVGPAREGDCIGIPGGQPSFSIRAIPLIPAVK